MKFNVGDRVEWADGHPDKGTVTLVQPLDPKRSRGFGDWWIRVQWDTGVHGWSGPSALRYLDVVTRLGDVVR